MNYALRVTSIFYHTENLSISAGGPHCVNCVEGRTDDGIRRDAAGDCLFPVVMALERMQHNGMHTADLNELIACKLG